MKFNKKLFATLFTFILAIAYIGQVLVGAVVGALVGIVAGPIGMLIGCMAGMLISKLS